MRTHCLDKKVVTKIFYRGNAVQYRHSTNIRIIVDLLQGIVYFLVVANKKVSIIRWPSSPEEKSLLIMVINNLILSMPYKLVLALGKTRLLLPRRLYGTSLVTNTYLWFYISRSGAAVNSSPVATFETF